LTVRFSQFPCITSSALSRVVSSFFILFLQCHATPVASRPGSRVKGAREAGVPSKTFDAADGSPPWTARRSSASSLSGIFWFTSTKARSLESYGEFNELHHPCIRSQLQTMILYPNSPFLLQRGGRALTQKGDRLSPTTETAGLPCMGASGTGWAASRSFQYSRTAKLHLSAQIVADRVGFAFRRHF
jgi:hypothetical protein